MKSAPIPATGFALYWDDTLRGFGLRVTKNGVRAFVLQDRVQGREHRITLGRWPGVSAAVARDIAKQRIGEIAGGADIVADRELARVHQLTLKQAVDDYLKRKVLKSSTVADVRRVMRETFDDWQKKPVTKITRAMVQSKYLQRAETSQARAVVSFRYLRAILNDVAVQHRGSDGAPVLRENPVKILSEAKVWHKIKPRSTVPTPTDLKVWIPAVFNLATEIRDENGVFNGGLANGEVYRDLLLFLAMTGCRRGEALGLRKQHVELNRGQNGLVTFKDTKNREDHVLPLTAYLHELLKRRMAASKSAFVFASRWESRPLGNLRYCMTHLSAASGMTFTPHDLRRLAATTLERCAVPYRTIKAVLNHKGATDITGQYIQIGEDMKLEALQKLGDYLLQFAPPDTAR